MPLVSDTTKERDEAVVFLVDRDNSGEVDNAVIQYRRLSIKEQPDPMVVHTNTQEAVAKANEFLTDFNNKK